MRSKTRQTEMRGQMIGDEAPESRTSRLRFRAEPRISRRLLRYSNRRSRNAAGVQFAAFGPGLSAEFSRLLPLDALTLRRSEDAFVDELFAPCVDDRRAAAAREFSARLSRPQSRAVRTRSPDVRGPAAGFRQHALAARRRRARHDPARGRRSAGNLQRADPGRRGDGPDRHALQALPPGPARISSSAPRAAFGVAVLLDCHSMPSSMAEGGATDFVLGDRYGASAAPWVVETRGKRAAARRLFGAAQQALCRRLHHRALRRPGGCRDMSCRSKSIARSTWTSARW